MEIKPIRKTKLNDIVFDQMKRLIIDGSWKQGERIPSENSLAEQFGVSRVTIRQALERLNAIGLTETRAGLGRYVCVYDAGQIMQNLTPAMFLNTASMQEINDFREMLESWSAGKAAENATDEEIQALEQNYIAMQESAEEKLLGVGLRNVISRVHLLYGREATLSCTSDPSWGTLIDLTLPYERKEGQERENGFDC